MPSRPIGQASGQPCDFQSGNLRPDIDLGVERARQRHTRSLSRDASRIQARAITARINGTGMLTVLDWASDPACRGPWVLVYDGTR
ncbi:hypothetical protein GCM10010187_12950 [Actinomadura coerulea]|nr:hypothetical protein GCM10010187_12950 [Actinomadura coerulea]